MCIALQPGWLNHLHLDRVPPGAELIIKEETREERDPQVTSPSYTSTAWFEKVQVLVGDQVVAEFTRRNRVIGLEDVPRDVRVPILCE